MGDNLRANGDPRRAQGDDAQAEAAHRVALAAAPQDAGAGAGLAAYRRGLAAAPADADLHGNLAFSLAISGDTEAVLRSMQTAAVLPSGQAWQPANLVLLLAMAGREDTARMRAQAAGTPDETFVALLDQGRGARRGYQGAGAVEAGGNRPSCGATWVGNGCTPDAAAGAAACVGGRSSKVSPAPG